MKFRKLYSINELDFNKNELIPVVVQDWQSLKVLTLAYVNREALEKTVETGFAHFYRRSYGRIMKKGETSGNTQEVTEILVDCDGDALLFIVKPKGSACHLGEESCFHNKLKTEIRRV